MSTNDQITIKSRPSLDKNKISEGKRGSISSSEFNDFYNAYEEYSKEKSIRKSEPNSLSSSIERSHYSKATTTSNYGYTQKKQKDKKTRRLSMNPLCYDNTNSESEISENSKNHNLKNIKKRRSLIYYQSTNTKVPLLSKDLFSIVDSLKELEDEID
jgi:hypothetical protein